MTVHKLSAGDGYTYLTRQVASADRRREGQSLADYDVAQLGACCPGGDAGADDDIHCW